MTRVSRVFLLILVLADVLLITFALVIYNIQAKPTSFLTGDLETVAKKYPRLVVASGLSSNHFQEAQDMIGSVQHFLPTTRIIIYDLGLTAKHRKELKTLCKVELRTFNFSQYPPHFKDLKKYAWKPAIIRSLAHEFKYFFWGDSSVRMVDNFTSTLPKLDVFPLKAKIHGSKFKIIQLTHSGTLRYLHVTREMMQGILGVQAGLLLIKSNKLAEHFLELWYDCAMHEACIAPKGAKVSPCNFKMAKPLALGYIGCHRYDQSALNVLLRREFGKGVFRKALDGIVNHLKIAYNSVGEFKLKRCL